MHVITLHSTKTKYAHALTHKQVTLGKYQFSIWIKSCQQDIAWCLCQYHIMIFQQKKLPLREVSSSLYYQHLNKRLFQMRCLYLCEVSTQTRIELLIYRHSRSPLKKYFQAVNTRVSIIFQHMHAYIHKQFFSGKIEISIRMKV